MSKLLITGIAGFTGRYVAAAAISEGYDVHGIVQQSYTSIEGCQVHIVDLRDATQVDGLIKEIAPDYVIHLAAVSFVAHGDTHEIYSSNVVGSLNLLDALIKFRPNISKILIASSGNIYGSKVEMPIKEGATPKPVNDYGVSKLAMEMAVALRQHLLPITIVRPFNYTGVGQSDRFLVPKLVNAFKSGQKTVELGNINVARDFSDVRDVAKVYLRLLTSDSSSGVFNVCSGVAAPLEDILNNLDEPGGI